MINFVKARRKLRQGIFYSRFDGFHFQEGFTLMELLVAIGVLTVLAGIGITIVMSIYSSYNKSIVISSLQREGSRVMEEFSRIIKAADNINIPTPGSPISSVLNLTINDESLEYQQNGECETVDFSLSSGSGGGYINKQLSDCQGTPLGAGAVTNTDVREGVDVTGLTFTLRPDPDNPDVIEIDLVLSQASGAPGRRDYQATIELSSRVSTRIY